MPMRVYGGIFKFPITIVDVFDLKLNILNVNKEDQIAEEVTV